jgi:hypothetical protein
MVIFHSYVSLPEGNGYIMGNITGVYPEDQQISKELQFHVYQK